jgi:hypothetical protein
MRLSTLLNPEAITERVTVKDSICGISIEVVSENLGLIRLGPV